MASRTPAHATPTTTSAAREARGHAVVLDPMPPEGIERAVATVPIGDLRRREHGGPRALALHRRGDRLRLGVRRDAHRDALLVALVDGGDRGRRRGAVAAGVGLGGRRAPAGGVGAGRPGPRRDRRRPLRRDPFRRRDGGDRRAGRRRRGRGGAAAVATGGLARASAPASAWPASSWSVMWRTPAGASPWPSSPRWSPPRSRSPSPGSPRPRRVAAAAGSRRSPSSSWPRRCSAGRAPTTPSCRGSAPWTPAVPRRPRRHHVRRRAERHGHARRA